MAVPNTFASATTSIPLANLDANFAYYDAGFSLSGSAVTFAGSITLTTGTANGVPYLNASKVLTSGSVLTFDGTTLSSTKFAGALNGTVGATTANTGTFTAITGGGRLQLTALGSPPASGSGLELGGGSSPIIFSYNRTGSAYLPLDLTASAFGWSISGTSIGTFSSTGINGMAIGATTASTGAFTSLTASTTLGVTGVSTLTAGAVIQGLTVGRGGGAVATNTAVGASALVANSSGSNNTGYGSNALAAMQTGSNNVAVGSGALASAVAVSSAVAIGLNALNLHNSGTGVVAIGLNSQALNAASNQCVSVGSSTLAVATSGTGQTAIGNAALASSVTGSSNTALGRSALNLNTSGSSNVSLGRDSLNTNTTGSQNTAVGLSAGSGLKTTTIAATALVNGTSYQIVTMGTTTAAQWIASGAVTGTVGETFTANATPGVGTGTVATTADVSSQCLLNTFVGYTSGLSVTTGSKNVILGSYTGSAAPISATGSNYVVLSDGDGNVRAYFNGSIAIFNGTISPVLATTAAAPTYVKGAMYFDTTLNKLRIGGATGWETVTSV